MTTPRITDAERAALPVARAAVEGRASSYGPADAIVFALGREQLLRAPGEAVDLAQRLEEQARLAARLAELEPYEELTPQTCARGLHLAWFVDSEEIHACPWCRIAELEAGAPPSVVYRAEHCDMPIGTFTSREAAGAAAEDALRRIAPTLAAIWQQSVEDDDVVELVTVAYGHTSSTGHGVRRVTVEPEYDPEAEG